MLRSILIALALFTAVFLPASAHEQKRGELTIMHAWAQASSDQARNGAVYASSISSNASEPDRLIGAQTEIATRAELHSHVTDEGVIRMQTVKAVEIVPGTPTVLRPGGVHIMLLGLRAPLKVYDTFAVTLVFEKAGPVVVEVMVEESGTIDPKHEEPLF